jgi:TonB family protein
MSDSANLLAHWRGRLSGYRSHLARNAESPEGPAAVEFNRYMNAVQGRLQTVLLDCTGTAWRNAAGNQPRRVELEIVFEPSGAVRDEGVVASSDSPAIDAAALETVVRATPYPSSPPGIRSPDGLTYVRWSLSVDPTYGCTSASRQFLSL